jgi:ArsR family transcriptional regulator
MMDRAQIEKISKALADDTRLQILQAIAEKKQMNCGEIVSLQGVTAATVSHHLKILSDAELIGCRREGQFVYSETIPATMEEYTRALTAFVGGKKSASRR